MATSITINTLPATTGYAKRTLVIQLTGTDAEKMDRIRLGLIADTKSVTGSSSTLVTTEDAVRYLIQAATT